MKTISSLALFLGLTCMPTIYAQCATGVDTGGQCIPPDALNPQGDTNPHARPRQPRVVWADRWGAIAMDSGYSVGVSENQASKFAASAEALQLCASNRNSQHCKVKLAYYNQCAAIAWGTRYSGVGNAQTQAQAQSEALQGCAKGAPDCKIVYTACSLPVRVQ